jgi:hypothetical protein
MNEPVPARDALCGILAASWAPDALPAEPVPWTAVLRVASTGTLAARLYSLTSTLRDTMPPDVQQTLEDAHYAAIAACVRARQELLQVRAALARLGTPVMLLKGAALAETLYTGSLAPRLAGDIDLLVPRPAMAGCQQVLLGLGYSAKQVEARAGTLLAYHSQEMYLPPSGLTTPVELHWHLFDVPYYMHRLPMDWFWEHSLMLSVGGQPFHVLDDVANLVYLPAHLALHHRFRGLHSLFDLALLIATRHQSLDWTATIAAARSFELATALRETLDHLAQCWPDLPLDEPRRLLAASMPSRSDGRIYRLITTEAPGATLNVYANLISLPGLAARVRYVWDNIVPQAAYIRKRYHVRAGWQMPYWYLYRFGEGLWRFARTLPRLWRADRGTSEESSEERTRRMREERRG